MRIAVFGAGAIGGYLAVELARAGHEVAVVARGETLAAIRAHGLRLRIQGEERVVRPEVTDDPAAIGPVDYLILALKANAVPQIAPRLPPLLGPETAVVTAMNGLPFWYFHALEGPWRDRRIEAVEPEGTLWETIGPERCIGCVVYPACEVVERGVIQHVEGDRFSLGEPDGSRSKRVQRLSEALIEAGFKAPIRPRIRDEIWVKLWGNVALNPLSALTRATLAQICGEPATRAFARNVMLEVQAVADALGERMAVDVDARLNGAAEVGEHKTSMLQDLELGRPMEVDAVVSAVVELARVTQTETPYLDALDGMVRLLVKAQAERRS